MTTTDAPQMTISLADELWAEALRALMVMCRPTTKTPDADAARWTAACENLDKAALAYARERNAK